MDNRAEIRAFLVSRRARITPEQAGLPAYGSNRRVPGLRREELAMLAGVSVDYYTRIERGGLSGVSDSVLWAIADALRLDEVERAHLHDLARASGSGRRPARPRKDDGVTDSLRRLVEAITVPAVLQNHQHQILHANVLGRALYADVIDGPARGNYASFIFFDTRSRDFYPDWERMAADNVAMLRAEAARDPYDSALTALIGQLSTRSDEFRRLWAAHDVHAHRSGRKRLRHRVVGELELSFEALDLAAHEGLRIYTYSADPGTASADALEVLAISAATPASAQAR